MPPDNAARSLYRYVGSLTRPVTKLHIKPGVVVQNTPGVAQPL